MEKPFFSIIIPVYNRAGIILNTIESVLNQTFRNFEIIVVDDGSKDNTREVVQSINDHRVKYIYQDNAERSVARNNGARNSLGEYLLFLDSDDSYETNHLQGLFDFIQTLENKVSLIICHCRYHVIDSNGEHFEEPQFPLIEKGKEFDYVLYNPITPTRVCLHRKIFDDFQFDPEIVIVEDQVLWVSIATRYPVVQYTKYTVNYTLHEENSVNLKKNPYIVRLKGLKRMFFHPDYRFVQEKITNEQRDFILAECYFNIAKCHRLLGQRFDTAKALWNSFLTKPDYRNKERLYMLFR
jgi:glycosyltransferase involved in cell wall biosynthesis